MAYYSEKQKKYWAAWPAKRINKWWYITKIGVLGFGLPVFLLSTLFKIALQSKSFNLREFLIGLPVWAVMGFFWGWWMFFMTEKKYKFYLENRDEDE